MEKKDSSMVWLVLVIGLLLGGSIGAVLTNGEDTVTEIEVEVPGETVYVDVPAESNITEVSIDVPSEDFWVATAWEQILEEYDNDEEFLMCDGHEFDDDELETELEEASISWDEDGNYKVTLEYQFEWEDNSDERDCKVNHKFTVIWDDNDVADENWDEASVKMKF